MLWIFSSFFFKIWWTHHDIGARAFLSLSVSSSSFSLNSDSSSDDSSSDISINVSSIQLGFSLRILDILDSSLGCSFDVSVVEGSSSSIFSDLSFDVFLIFPTFRYLRFLLPSLKKNFCALIGISSFFLSDS